MNIPLTPEIEKFIEMKLSSGEFASAAEVIKAGLDLLMNEDLDDETLAAIEEGEAQLDRGEGLPLEEAFAQLRKKHLEK